MVNHFIYPIIFDVRLWTFDCLSLVRIKLKTPRSLIQHSKRVESRFQMKPSRRDFPRSNGLPASKFSGESRLLSLIRLTTGTLHGVCAKPLMNTFRTSL